MFTYITRTDEQDVGLWVDSFATYPKLKMTMWFGLE
jgi:hypothetical protein